MSEMNLTLKDWTDLLTGGGAIISAIAAGVAAWASRTSAKAAEQSSKATRDTLAANEKVANNDWRIRLMQERMQVWRGFDNLMMEFLRWGKVGQDDIVAAQKHFQFAQFLFDSEIDNYLKDLVFKLLMHIQMSERELSQAIMLGEVTDAKRAKQVEEKMRLEAWLADQQRDGKALFQKHMSLIN